MNKSINIPVNAADCIDLKQLIIESLQEFFDPDFGLELRREIKSALKKSLDGQAKGKLVGLDEIKRQFGLS
ncbi:MAG: hypothetical protein PHQ23_13220 [Candidatus Wallbacteria bacterium]|nr:hypothetical protein [Candidatus Wallbacteria bacterium]